MKVNTGCVIRKDNKILMVKEAKKHCYGQWNYPVGMLEEGEKITEGALRETLEETGCQVKLTGVLPIISFSSKEENYIIIRFTAEMIKEDISFDKEEILDVKWIDIEEIKNMKKEELRGYDVNIKLIHDLENNHIYPLEIFDTNHYNS